MGRIRSAVLVSFAAHGLRLRLQLVEEGILVVHGLILLTVLLEVGVFKAVVGESFYSQSFVSPSRWNQVADGRHIARTALWGEVLKIDDYTA